MGSKKVIDLKNGAIAIIGLLAGFFFSNEIIHYFFKGISFYKNSAVPTLIEAFGEVGGTLSIITIAGIILITIAMIKRWNLLTLIEFIFIGVVIAALLPMIYPQINQWITQNLGFSLPELGERFNNTMDNETVGLSINAFAAKIISLSP